MNQQQQNNTAQKYQQRSEREKIRETEIIENYKWIRREFVYNCLPSLWNREKQEKKQMFFFVVLFILLPASQRAHTQREILMCHKRWFHHLLSTVFIRATIGSRIVSFARRWLPIFYPRKHAQFIACTLTAHGACHFIVSIWNGVCIFTIWVLFFLGNVCVCTTWGHPLTSLFTFSLIFQ